MGKKKGYNVAEMDSKQEENKKIEIKESFTVQDYDAIANEVKNDEPCKQLNADDCDQDEMDDDSSCGSHQSGTQETNEVQPVSYKEDNVDGDQLKENDNNQSATKAKDDTKSNLSSNQQFETESSNLKASEQNTSKTKEAGPASYKDDGVDDVQLKEDVDNQSTKSKDDTKSNLGAPTKQQSATESSNLKASGQYTSIDLGEIKQAPKNSPERNWLKRNLFYIIGIAVVVGLIAIISIAASSRKQPTSGDKDEVPGPRKGQLPPGVKPAIEENEKDYITTTTSIAPSEIEPITNGTTTDGTNGDTLISTHQTEIQHNISTSVAHTTSTTTLKPPDYDDDYKADDNNDSADGSGAALSLFTAV